MRSTDANRPNGIDYLDSRIQASLIATAAEFPINVSSQSLDFGIPADAEVVRDEAETDREDRCVNYFNNRHDRWMSMCLQKTRFDLRLLVGRLRFDLRLSLRQSSSFNSNPILVSLLPINLSM